MILVTLLCALSLRSFAESPYPPSRVFAGWDTLRQAAFGSDLWQVTWAKDGSLYAAWGDGERFGGSDSDGRVAMGYARIDGEPRSYLAVNVNGGRNTEASVSHFPYFTGMESDELS
jgi:hypothetical protein